MGKYCCFLCPKEDHEDTFLHDNCPTCGRSFGFPLYDAPAQIGQYKIVKPLRRGFYAATYVVTRAGLFGRQAVLKVTPKSFYTYFQNKDFRLECETHARVADGTDHLVKFRDLGDAVIRFGNDNIDCYYAELDYESGPLLSEYLDGSEPISAKMVAQISIDLLRLKQELENKGVYHNDLHAENIIIKHLDSGQYRANAVEGSVRAIAIDLGSVLEHSRSDSDMKRYGDLHWICNHLDRLVARILGDPDQSDDLGYRLASALQHVLQLIAAQVENQRTPAADDLIDEIWQAYWRLPRHPWRPWNDPLNLPRLSASYNAQTLQPWHVPLLLVDQDEEWLNQIAIPGPQIVVGMRGCGKTIFLRALQFHARASKKHSDESDDSVLKRMKTDDFLGLFVSAQRLLNTPMDPQEAEDRDLDPFPRLFVAYALEAVRALIHLGDLDKGEVEKTAHILLATTVASFLTGLSEPAPTDVPDLEHLDQRLDRLLVHISRGDSDHVLRGHPSHAFTSLAETLRRCAQCWSSVNVFFLLDDVSTRYLKERRIIQLLSHLIFQSPTCAFKMTSEIQTMALGLTTPGENLLVREGRDLAVFDLGSEVYQTIKSKKGKQFVEQILSKRAKHFAGHPTVSPSGILGNQTLETIALEIASSTESSSKRKQVYRGITALAHVCVGDIGDVITLYERILRQDKGIYPIAAKIQSECFQDHCSHRLYDLNRRGAQLKDVAKSFAEASYELLVKSYRNFKRSGKGRPRLRQYTSIYVRVTAGHRGRQIERLRDLIDAGVFVFAGGRPRSKTRDSDPILQFKLTFRRIYGLVNFIGLSERDRFELSGNELEEWLDSSGDGREILLRNLGGGIEDGEDGEEDDDANTPPISRPVTLFDSLEALDTEETEEEVQGSLVAEASSKDIISITEMSHSELARCDVGTVVLGLGFEERTLRSAQKLAGLRAPAVVCAVRYPEKGKSEEIIKTLGPWNTQVDTVDYGAIRSGSFFDRPGPALVDVTGLAKPIIFHAVRERLRRDGFIFVMHTGARTYYPTNDDLKQLIKAQEDRNRHQFFEIMTDIMTGEDRPYELLPLIPADADPTRRRVLFAFASPKHERLLSLLDERDFDRLELVAPDGDSARNRVAREIAYIAATDNSNSAITHIDSNDLAKAVRFLLGGFARFYVEDGFNFEIGLTGSKMETVAAGALSAIRKVSQCWYVRPQRFDPEQFTKGAVDTRFFRISVEG